MLKCLSFCFCNAIESSIQDFDKAEKSDNYLVKICRYAMSGAKMIPGIGALVWLVEYVVSKCCPIRDERIHGEEEELLEDHFSEIFSVHELSDSEDDEDLEELQQRAEAKNTTVPVKTRLIKDTRRKIVHRIRDSIYFTESIPNPENPRGEREKNRPPFINLDELPPVREFLW